MPGLDRLDPGIHAFLFLLVAKDVGGGTRPVVTGG
jgi:hypothetical protein